jgi:tetratricopeptide (TPR) repeat protein
MWVACVGMGVLMLDGCVQRAGSLLSGPAEARAEAPFKMVSAAPLTVAARAEDRFLVRLSQSDVDAGLELRDSAGSVVESSSAPAGRRGREFLYWQADRDATYTVAAMALGQLPSSARARIELFRLPRDLSPAVLRALQSQQAGARRDTARIAEARERHWMAAATAWGELGERSLQADALLQLGALRYGELQAWDRAQVAASAALSLFEAARDDKSVADAAAARHDRDRAGAHARRSRRTRRARRRACTLLQKRAAPVSQGLEAAGSGRGGAQQSRHQALPTPGRATGPMAELTAAADELLRARGRRGAQRWRSATWRPIAFERGDYRRALRAQERLLAAMPQDTPSEERAVLLQNGATALVITGEIERALEWNLRSIGIARSLGDADLEARGLTGLGVAHLQLGQPSLAVPHLRAAVQLLRSPGERDRLGTVLTHLGNAQRQLGAANEAKRLHEQALQQLGTVAPPTARLRALIGLGLDHAAAGQHGRAVEAYSLALQVPVTNAYSPLVPLALLERSRSQRALGAVAAARRDVDAAVERAARADIPDMHAIALIERARLQRQSGLDDAALADSDRALQIAAPLRAATTNPDNRVMLAQRLRGAFDLQVSILATRAEAARRRGEPDAAAGLARRALARASDANLRSAWLNTDAAGPRLPSADLYEALAGRRYRLEQLADSGTPQPERMLRLEADIAMLRSRLNEATRQRTQVDAPRTDPVADAQRTLAADDALLVYWLSSPQSWLWVVTRDGLELLPLADAAEFERVNRTLLAGIARLQPVDAQAERLARMLLPGAALPTRAQSVLVIPDGIVAAVPWPLLQRRMNVGGIVQLPGLGSMSAGGRALVAGASHRLLLFGDPVYGPDDPRVQSGAVRRARDPNGPGRLPRLPGTARELASIAAFSTPAQHESLTGLAATRDALLGAELGRVDVLHLAAHAALDADVPELAAIVLAQFSMDGRPIAGDLRASDILRLDVTPPLVVLSACDAAAEPSVQAAGMMNLTRAFLARGSRQVVASLWPASDASTTELMTEFYRQLLQQGATPDIALARAQATLAASPRWSAPFYWAGFVVLGGHP